MKYRILGPIEVSDGVGLVQPRGSKQRALLAILLLNANQFVSREVLIDELWGEQPPQDAGHSLESHVSRLRKLLNSSGDTLTTRPGGYRLDVEEDDLDLTCFERLAEDGRQRLRAGDSAGAATLLREALALWRGPPLEGASTESFVHPEIERLAGRRLDAYEDLFEAELARGRHGDVVAELQTLARQNPLRERLQAQLMLALYRGGHQPEALEVYRTTRGHLVSELGLEPSQELRELEQAVLRQDPALAAPVASESMPKPGRSTPTQPRQRLRVVVAAAGVIAVVGGIVAGVVLGLGGGSAPSSIGPGAVGIVDPAVGSINAAVDLGADAGSLTEGGGRIWVALLDRKTITRLDQSGRVDDVFATGGAPTAVAASNRAVWVADGFAGKLVRLDLGTGEVTGSVPVEGHPAAIAIDRNGVWVANTVLDAVQRVDPETLESQLIRVGPGPVGLAADGNSVWVASGFEHSLTRIDSVTGEVLARRIPLRHTPAGVAVGAGSVWVTEPGADAVARIDADSGRAEATIHIRGGPSPIVARSDGVWVGNVDAKSVTEIDPANDHVTRTVPIGGAAQALLFVGERLWVGTASR